MKKIGFVCGAVSSFIGSLILVITSAIKEIFPKYAFLQFEINGGRHTPSEYILDFSLANIIALALIIAGIALAVYCFLSKGEKLPTDFAANGHK